MFKKLILLIGILLTPTLVNATVGLGNITVGGDSNSDLAGLNRDTNKSQEITRDMTTGALDGSVTVDNRIFSSNGRTDIANQHENLGENTAKAALGASATIVNTGRTVIDTITTGETGEIGQNWKSGQTKIVDIVNVGTGGRSVLNNLSNGQDINAIESAVNGELKIYYDEKDGAGFYDINARNDSDINGVYLNAADGTATNTDKFMNVWGHESAHEYTDSEKVANSVGDFTNSMWDWSNTLNLTSTDTTGSVTSQGWYNNQLQNTITSNTIKTNTAQALSVPATDRDNFGWLILSEGSAGANLLLSNKPVPIVETIKPVVETTLENTAKIGVEQGVKTASESSNKFIEPTNAPQSPPKIPENFIKEIAQNGKGEVYRSPGSTGNGGTIRIMEPTEQYPTGYWRIYNSEGQPLNPATGKPGTAAETHIPLP